MTLEQLYKLEPKLKEDNYEKLSDIIEYLSCCSVVHKELVYESRWWNLYEYIVKLNSDAFISYVTAEATGDNTPTELGFEQSDYGLDSIHEVVPVQVTTTVYKRKEN